MNDQPMPMLRELADDLGWLEAHAQTRPETSQLGIPIRFAAGLVRNLIAPALAGTSPPPLHLCVVGGAGTGKSTVANLLCGAMVAEANPQAGFTRHPVAFLNADTSQDWGRSPGFLGPLRHETNPGPSSRDEDIYQIRVVAPTADATLLDRFVVWDCPDMTTWAAKGYAPRLLEVAALADVIVYVASDERYNDAVPTQYLNLFLASGKPVVVVLTKVAAENAAALCDHFRTEVLANSPRGRVAVMAIPFMTHDELTDLPAKAARHRIPLLNQIAVLDESPDALRRQNVDSAIHHLRAKQNEILTVARDDVTALDEWVQLVRTGQTEFVDRYKREYLTSARFHRFDEALVKLIEMLEIPGAGKLVTNALYLIRTPYRMLKAFFGKMFTPPDVAAIPERPVLEAAFSSWIDRIQATALAKAKQHDLWKQAAQALSGELGGDLRKRFLEDLNRFQASQTDEIDRTARAIYEDLEKSPNTLTALRTGKLAMDVTAILGGILTGGSLVQDLFIVPAAAAVSQQLTEWAGASYVDQQREQARARQSGLVTQYIADPLGDWLAKWPTTSVATYERLKEVLERVPRAIAEIANQVPLVSQ